MASDVKYKVVFHDFHGFWTHHPHRAIKAFTLAWREMFSNKIEPSFAVEVLHRPSNMTIQQKVVQMMAERGYSSRLSASFAKKVLSYYKKIYLPNRGLKSTVAKLASYGVAQVILSNGYTYQVAPVVESWDLSPYIAGIYGREKGKRKPKPGISLEKLCAQYGLPWNPEECLLVGDYFEDLSTARNSGVTSVLMVTSRNEHFPKEVPLEELVMPDFVILEPVELLDVVLGLPRNGVDAERNLAMQTVGLKTKTTAIWDTWPYRINISLLPDPILNFPAQPPRFGEW